MFQKLTFNIGGRVRHETLEGRKYLVAPVAMLAEAVLPGSDGPLFYPAEECKRDVHQWNHKPITIGHPSDGSACDPSFIESAKVGMMLRTIWNNKLRTEAWLEETRLEKLAKPVAEALAAGKMVETSTGLYVDVEDKPGTFKGKAYKGIARNYRPDHLAILTDKEGAYSIKDGGGLLQLNEEYPDEVQELTRQIVQETLEKVGWKPEATLNKESDMTKKELVDGLITNEATKWEEADRGFLMGLEEKQLEKFVPKEVKKTEVTNSGPDEDEDEDEDEIVTKKKVKNSKKSSKKSEEDEDEEEPVKNKKEKTPAAPKPVSAAEYVKNAPPEIAAILNYGLQAHTQQKTQLIETIVANGANVFTKEQLAVKDLPELHGIAALARASQPQISPNPIGFGQPLYFGAQGYTPPPTGNSGFQEEVLDIPTMNFDNDSEEDDE